MKKQALILTWSGYQDQEVIYPYYRLLEDKFNIDIMAENVGWFYGILGTKMEATIKSTDINNTLINTFDLLVLPGGVKALEKLRQEEHILKYIHDYVNLGQIVTSTCHGAQLLISAKVTSGKKISGYYSIKDDINNSGATYVDEPYVVDNNIVSSPHYKHMGAWMKKTLDVYYEKNK